MREMASDGQSPEADGQHVESTRLRTIVDRLPAMVAYWGRDERCQFANRAYERWFGVDPDTMPGRSMRELLGPIYALNKPFIEAALRGEEQEFERDIPDPLGGPVRHSHALYIPDVVDGDVRGFSVLVVDITRRKRAEEALLRVERQLQATERLAAVATLAAGIAHEINNPLASVIANLELIARHERPGSSEDAGGPAAVAAAREAAERIKAIVGSMKLLARGETTAPEMVDINATVEQSIAATSPVLRYRARLVLELGDVPPVFASSSQIAQVIVNLLVNAAQALPEGEADNEVRITTRPEGDRVVVAVSDSGCGMDETVQRRVFEPFFTTKSGDGTGLGLSISKAIVTGWGGTIDVRSAAGRGSTFTVALPKAEASLAGAADARGRAALVPPRAEAKPAPRARIVLVDDDNRLRRSLELLLSEHDVISFATGRAAIDYLVVEGRPVDVILTDLMMPGVTGADVYAQTTRVRPELADRFVIMTGGAFTPAGRTFLASVRTPVLEKPFSSELLEDTIRRLAK